MDCYNVRTRARAYHADPAPVPYKPDSSYNISLPLRGSARGPTPPLDGSEQRTTLPRFSELMQTVMSPPQTPARQSSKRSRSPTSSPPGVTPYRTSGSERETSARGAPVANFPSARSDHHNTSHQYRDRSPPRATVYQYPPPTQETHRHKSSVSTSRSGAILEEPSWNVPRRERPRHDGLPQEPMFSPHAYSGGRSKEDATRGGYDASQYTPPLTHADTTHSCTSDDQYSAGPSAHSYHGAAPYQSGAPYDSGHPYAYTPPAYAGTPGYQATSQYPSSQPYAAQPSYYYPEPYAHSYYTTPPQHYHPYSGPRHPLDKSKRKGNLPKAATDIMKNYLVAHLDTPYPSDEDKIRLCAQTGLQISQVSNWFINARRRLVPKVIKAREEARMRGLEHSEPYKMDHSDEE